MNDPPHMSTFATEDPLDPQALGLCVHLAVQFLHQFIIGEGTEVATLGGIGTDRVIKSDMIKEKQI